MTKKEFLKTLREKLEVLEKKELEDIIEEYKNHIEEKVKDGKTEDEAIKDFGDIDELVDEILSAYKINQDYVKSDKGNIENIINTITDEMVKFFKKVADVFSNKKGEDFIRIICKVIVILILLWILHIPFYFIGRLGSIIFSVIPGTLNIMFSNIWYYLIELSYLVIAVLALYVAIKKMILEEEITFETFLKKEVNNKKDDQKDNSKTNQNKPSKKSVEKNQSDADCNETQETPVIKYNDDLLPNNNVLKAIFQPIIMILKLFVIILSLPIAAILVGLFLVLGILISLLFKGIYVISFFFILLGLIFIISSIFSIIYHITFPKGDK